MLNSSAVTMSVWKWKTFLCKVMDDWATLSNIEYFIQRCMWSFINRQQVCHLKRKNEVSPTLPHSGHNYTSYCAYISSSWSSWNYTMSLNQKGKKIKPKIKKYFVFCYPDSFPGFSSLLGEDRIFVESFQLWHYYQHIYPVFGIFRDWVPRENQHAKALWQKADVS